MWASCLSTSSSLIWSLANYVQVKLLYLLLPHPLVEMTEGGVHKDLPRLRVNKSQTELISLPLIHFSPCKLVPGLL